MCIPYTCSIPNCTACNENGSACVSCITKFHVYNDINKACVIICTIGNCAICLPNATFCEKCREGYVREYESGSCYSANFSHCSLVGYDLGKYECWDCDDKYTIDTATWTQCFLACIDVNCKVCDFETLSTCSKCLDGYSLQLLDSKISCLLTPSLMPRCQLVSEDQT
jgi:hypothetical protein